LFGKLKDGGIVRVTVTEKDGEKDLGFEYLKADTPIRPRRADDRDPDDSGPEGSGPGPDGSAPKASKPKAKRSPRRATAPKKPGAKPGLGSSPVPKVPLGSR
ncbi:MAG: hypothetical protein WBB50_08105, partial [Methyloceanibacter sp.]